MSVDSALRSSSHRVAVSPLSGSAIEFIDDESSAMTTTSEPESESRSRTMSSGRSSSCARAADDGAARVSEWERGEREQRPLKPPRRSLARRVARARLLHVHHSRAEGNGRFFVRGRRGLGDADDDALGRGIGHGGRTRLFQLGFCVTAKHHRGVRFGTGDVKSFNEVL